MIKLLDGEFVPWDMFSARVLAAYRSYHDMPGCQFYAGGPDGPRRERLPRPTAVCSIVDGFVILSTKENAEWEELIAFLHMQPWRQLQCMEEVAARLPFPIEWTSMLVKFTAPRQEPSNDSLTIAGDPGEVYDILARCFPDMKNRNDWMADLAMRWRKGTAQSWTLDGMCTASAIALTENYAFLGALGTLPEARGKGLAGKLLTHIAAALGGREIWLSCREELRGFYESIGFEWAGSMITLQKENDA